jgi:outer membrane protein assembly complex protein YaeT
MALAAGIFGLLLLFLHSTPTSDWLRRSLVERLSSFGTVEIGSLEYRLWRFEVTARAIHIEPAADESVLSVDVEEIQGRWVPFRQLDVTAIRPVVRLRVKTGSQEPASPEVVEPAVPSWLASLRIVEGTIGLQTEDGTTELEMAPLDVTVMPDSVPGGTRASIRIGGGSLAYGARSLAIRRIDAEAIAAGGDLSIESGEIATEAGDARATGRIDTLVPFNGSFDLEFHLDAGILGRTLESPPDGIGGDLAGTARVRFSDGDLASEGAVDSPNLAVRNLGPIDGGARWDLRDGLLRVNGGFQRRELRVEMESALDLARDEQAFTVEIRAPSVNRVLFDAGGPRSPWDAGMSATLSGRTSGFRAETLDGRGVVRLSGRDLSGVIDVAAEPGVIHLESDELRIPGGRASARARVMGFETVGAEYDVELSDLARAVEPFVDSGAGRFSGELHLQGRTAGAIADASSLRSSLRLESGDFRIGGNSFVLYGRADQRGTSFELDRLSLAAAENGSSGSASLSGEIDFGRRRLDVLGSLETFPIQHLTPVEGLSGSASGTVAAEGSFDSPRGTASVQLSPLGYSDLELPPIGLELQSDGARLSARATRLDSELIVANAEVGLGGEYPLEADVDLDVLPWKELTERVRSDAVVEVNGSARVRGPLLSPSLLEADVDVEKAALTIRERTISASAFSLGVHPESVEVDGLQLLYGDEALAVDGVLGREVDSGARIDLEGGVALEMIELWLPGVQAEGVVQIEAELGGSTRAPHLEGAVTLEGGRLVDGNRAIEGLRLRARAEGTRVEIETFEGDVLGGSLRASGNVPIPGVAGGGAPQSLDFELSGADVIRLVPGARGMRSMATSVSAEGRLLFPGGALDGVEASGEIQEVLIASEGGIVSLVEPAAFRYGEAALEVDEIHLGGDATDLRIQVRPPAVALQGTVDLQMANALMPESAYLDGVASFDAQASRTGESWSFVGGGRVSDAALSIERPAFAVTDVNATLVLDGGTVQVVSLTGRAGGGTLEGEGSLSIPGVEGGNAGLRLDLRARRVRLEYPEGMRSELDSTLVLESREGRYLLSGKVDVVQADYRRPISPERELLDALRRKTLSIEGEPGLAGNVDLDIAVSTRRAVVVDNNLGRMRWRANLLVRGTLDAPEASGTLSAAPGGTIAYARNRYELENARIVLESYPVEPAELDIQASTEVGGREISLSILGKTDNLRTTLESPSDPALSRGDVASLLLTGRTLQEVSGDEGEVLAQEAATYLGSGLLNLTESDIRDALPLTSVRLEPGIVGSETDPGVRFSLGRAITEDLFLTYSIGLDDPEEQLWIVDYDLPKRLKLRAIREDGNEYTGGISQVAVFDLHERSRPKRLNQRARAKIVSVATEGPLPLPPETVAEALRLEAGDDYDYWQAREEAERLTSVLRDASYRSARVTPMTIPEDAGRRDPVSLIYEIDTGPRVFLELRGENLPADLGPWALERFDGVIPPRAQALRVARQLTWELMSRGYYSAAVEPAIEETEEEVHVVYEVTLGREGSDVDVLIEGNDSLPDDEIEMLLPPTDSPRFFDLVFGRAEELKQEIRLLYSAEGYLEAEVLELTTRVDPATADLNVVLTLDEGPRFDVGTVVFTGANQLPEPQLLAEVQLGQGAPFRFLTHLADRQRLASLYRREGFPDARVRSSLQRGEGRVDVTFEVEEGEPARVGEIRILGAQATREGVIRGALTFEPGGTLRVSDLTETQRRLYNLRIFRSVDVRPQGTEDPNVRNVVIEVTELPDLRVGYGVRYSTDDQLELTGDVEFVNVFGTARQLGFHAFANRRMSEIRATLAIPSFFGRDVGSDFFVSRETEEGEGFRSEAWSATFQQGRRIFSGVLAQWSFTHRQAAVTETEPSGPFGLDVQADRSVLAFSLIEDTRSSLVRPRTGRFWNATLSFAPQFLGSDLRFLKLYGQFFYFRPLTGNVIWASTYRAGIGSGFGQYLLPTDRFRAGGPSSVRGFPVNELGPPDPITGTVIGGEGVIVMNQELRFPLFWRFGGIAFYDAGNVFLQAGDFNPIDLRHTTGLGLSMELPVGLITVDWAHLLNPPPNLPRSRWHFTFGYSF